MSKCKKPVIRMISIELLNIHAAYQRHNGSMHSKATQHIKSIADNWNDVLLDPLIVVANDDGTYDVIDGGNRVLAGKMARGVTHLPCRVVEVDGEEARAHAFINSNRGRRAVVAYDLYCAGVIAKDPLSCKIKQVVEENGYVISRHTGPKKFTAIVALRSIIKTNSLLAARSFEIAAEICDPENISNKLLRGLFVLLLDKKGLRVGDIDRLRLMGSKQIEAAIKTEIYEAPKGCTSVKVYANGIRRALRRRRKTA